MYQVAERATVNTSNDADTTHQNPRENGANMCLQLELVFRFFINVEILWKEATSYTANTETSHHKCRAF
jgi:hypothetical protein